MWPATRAGRRRFLAAAGSLAAYAAVLGIARQQRSPRLYRLGLVAPFEGIFRNDGYDALAICRAAVSEWNAAAGALRARLQVWAVDDGNDPEVAVRRARELAGDPLVVAVVGHVTPETGAIAAPVYREAGLLQISPTPLPPAPAPAAGPVPLSVGAPPSVSRAVSRVGAVSRGGAVSRVSAEEPPAGLLELALALGSSPPPSSVLLRAGYCSAPLAQAFPEVDFSAVVAEDTPSLDLLVMTAVRRALAAISAAVREGVINRERVLEAAIASAQNEGWVEEGVALYRPNVVATVVSCPEGLDP